MRPLGEKEPPIIRALRLFLGGPPVLMLLIASTFAGLAAAQGRWVWASVLGGMALVAVGLYLWQRWVVRRLLGP